MRIGVVGGTGTVGARVSAELAGGGHAVWILSRRVPGEVTVGSHRWVDLSSEEGPVEAVAGLDGVVDVSNVARPGRRMRTVMVDGTERLLRAEAEADVGLHVLISIVGIESVSVADFTVAAFSIDRGRIHEINVVRNPDKLRQLADSPR